MIVRFGTWPIHEGYTEYLENKIESISLKRGLLHLYESSLRELYMIPFVLFLILMQLILETNRLSCQ